MDDPPKARERALANARAIAEGRGPRRRFQQVPTFAKANETVIAIHTEHWKSARTEGQWRASMRDYVLPRLARKRVDAVTTAGVMAVLLPTWSTKRVTAGRVRQRIGMAPPACTGPPWELDARGSDPVENHGEDTL